MPEDIFKVQHQGLILMSACSASETILRAAEDFLLETEAFFHGTEAFLLEFEACLLKEDEFEAFLPEMEVSLRTEWPWLEF